MIQQRNILAEDIKGFKKLKTKSILLEQEPKTLKGGC